MRDTRFLLMRRCGGDEMIRVLECRCGHFTFHVPDTAKCSWCGSRWQISEEVAAK